MKKYKVTLTKLERDELQSIVKTGKRKAQTIRNALILLNCDEGDYGHKKKGQDISEVLHIGERTIDRIKKLFVEEGYEIALYGSPPSGEKRYSHLIDGDAEAHLIALSCSEPPEGCSKWSLRLLADKMVELKYVEEVSYETIRRTLKKMNLSLGR